MRKFLLFSIIMLLSTLAGVVFASGSGYIQINNGQIVTNRGQQFQAVAQFGNTGQALISYAWVECYVPQGLGTVGNVYNPFPMTYKADQQNGFNIAGGYYINIPQGQNYNFSFDVKVKTTAKRNHTVWCNLWGFDGTTWYWLDDAEASVQVNR